VNFPLNNVLKMNNDLRRLVASKMRPSSPVPYMNRIQSEDSGDHSSVQGNHVGIPSGAISPRLNSLQYVFTNMIPKCVEYPVGKTISVIDFDNLFTFNGTDTECTNKLDDLRMEDELDTLI
jgi:hypothetical protein